MERQINLNRMVASIPCMQPVLSFFKHTIKKKTKTFPRSLSCTVYIFYDAVSTVHIWIYCVIWILYVDLSQSLIFCLFHSSLNCASLFCNFMMCCTSNCHSDYLLDQWNSNAMYVCMYVYMSPVKVIPWLSLAVLVWT
jgi:hypothetical protein